MRKVIGILLIIAGLLGIAYNVFMLLQGYLHFSLMTSTIGSVIVILIGNKIRKPKGVSND